MNYIILLLLVNLPTDAIKITLTDALRLAFRQSPVAIQAQCSRTQSGLTLARGISQLFPTVVANLNYSRSEPSSRWSWNGNLTLSQVIFDPEAFGGLAGTIVHSDYHQIEAKEKLSLLTYDVTSKYLSLVKAQMLVAAAAAALDRSQENLRLVEERSRLGSASTLDVLRAQAALASVELARLQAEASLRLAADQLRVLLNLETDKTLLAVDSFPVPYGPDLDELERRAADIRCQNTGLKLAVRSATTARINCITAISRVLPSVSVHWTSSYLDTLFPTSYRQWQNQQNDMLGLKISFPLLDVKSYVLGVADAVNESRRTQASLQAARLSLEVSITEALLSFREARQQYASAEQNLKLHMQLCELARQEHRLGSISLFELLSAEADLFQARANYVSALCNIYVRAAHINYLLGSIALPEKEN